eukprot:1144349-Pelagomonas_calceolata.AAC.7
MQACNRPVSSCTCTEQALHTQGWRCLSSVFNQIGKPIQQVPVAGEGALHCAKGLTYSSEELLAPSSKSMSNFNTFVSIYAIGKELHETRNLPVGGGVRRWKGITVAMVASPPRETSGYSSRSCNKGAMGPQALSHRSTSPVSHFKALKLAIHKHHPPLVHAGIQRQRTGVQAIHLTITHTGLELLMLFKDSMRGRNGAKFLLNSRKCIDKSHMPFTKSQAEFKGRAGPGPGASRFGSTMYEALFLISMRHRNVRLQNTHSGARNDGRVPRPLGQIHAVLLEDSPFPIVKAALKPVKRAS